MALFFSVFAQYSRSSQRIKTHIKDMKQAPVSLQLLGNSPLNTERENCKSLKQFHLDMDTVLFTAAISKIISKRWTFLPLVGKKLSFRFRTTVFFYFSFSLGTGW